MRLYYPDRRRHVLIDGFRPRVARHPSGAQRVALPAGGAEGTEGWDAARHGPAPGENFGRPFPLALRAKLAAEEVTPSHGAASCCADEQSVGPPRVAPAHPSLLHCVVRVRSHVMRARSAVRYFISIQIRTFTYLEVLLRTRMYARRSASARASVANGRAIARSPGALATPSRFAGCSATLARKDEVDAVP